MDELDAHPSGMESEASEEGGGSKLPLLALIIGLIGIICGVAGIYMGAQATNALRGYQESQAARPDTTSQRLEAVEDRMEALQAQLGRVPAQIASIEERLGTMGSAQVALQRTDREMRDQTQRAFEGVSREVSSNRAQLNETTARLEELIRNSSPAARRAVAETAPTRATAPETSEGTAPPSTTEGETTTAVAEGAPAPEGVHVVEQGDTLSSIANRYGISLSQLMAVNPTVDPRRMRIGQQIMIPAR